MTPARRYRFVVAFGLGWGDHNTIFQSTNPIEYGPDGWKQEESLAFGRISL